MSCQASSEAYVAAIVGVIIIWIASGAISFVLRSAGSARRVGEWGNDVVDWLARLFHKKADPHLGDSVVKFRSSVIHSVSGRGNIVTGATFVQQLTQFAVLFIAVLALQGGFGGDVTLVEAFAAFAIARLAQFIPIPPGGLGTTDAILIGLLTTAGMSSSDAMAADLIWRAATLLPQVFIGIGTLLVWRRRQRDAAQSAT